MGNFFFFDQIALFVQTSQLGCLVGALGTGMWGLDFSAHQEKFLAGITKGASTTSSPGFRQRSRRESTLLNLAIGALPPLPTGSTNWLSLHFFLWFTSLQATSRLSVRISTGIEVKSTPYHYLLVIHRNMMWATKTARSLVKLLLFASTISGFGPGLPPINSVKGPPSSIRLQSSSEDSSSPSDAEIRFLGRGKNAIVRPGVVLLAPPDEFHHYLREAAVFVYAMGQDDDDVYVVRGAIIDHPTPFTIGEMLPAAEDGEDESSSPVFLQNLLYRGGELGDAVFMLHSDKSLGKDADQEMIGTSGIYQGGLDHALEKSFPLRPGNVKFFFSYMEFTEKELDGMLDNREDSSTQWVSVEVPPDLVLNSEWERGEAWAKLRNAVRER